MKFGPTFCNLVTLGGGLTPPHTPPNVRPWSLKSISQHIPHRFSEHNCLKVIKAIFKRLLQYRNQISKSFFLFKYIDIASLSYRVVDLKLPN